MTSARKQHLFYPVSILLIAVIGFWLRFRCLGCLGFRGDEDLTALAVKALSATGVPELPSGMIYLRFYLYQWLMSLSTGWLGFSEFSLRLPSVIFGTLLIPVAYYVASRFTDRNLAILVALGVALAYAEVEMARMARMYAPFFVVYLLAAVAIYNAHFVDRERLFSPVALALCFLALSLQQLAYSLAIFYLLAIFVKPRLKRTIALFLQAGAVGVGFIVFKSVQERYFYRAAELAANSTASAETAESSGGLVAALLGQIAMPDFGLLRATAGSSILTAMLFTILLAAILWWCWRGAGPGRLIARTAALLAVAAAAVHLFNLALVLLALAIVASGEGLAGTIRAQAWQRCAAICALLFAAWCGLAIAVAEGWLGDGALADESLRNTLRLLVDYPNFRLFWSFVLERPILALPLALGTAWGLARISDPDPDPAALFVTAGFWAVLFANGILETKFEFFRYNLHVDALFLALCVVGVARSPELFQELKSGSRGGSPDRQSSGQRFSGVLIGIAAVVVLLGVRPDLAVMESSRNYHESGSWYARNGMGSYPDFKGPAAYVRENMNDEDVILVFDPREYWNYIGRVDYWIYSDNYQSQTYLSDGAYRDLYLGVPVLRSLDEISAAISEDEPERVWILYDDSRLTHTRWVDDAIKEFVRDLSDRTVYRGRDQDTFVICFRGDSLSATAPCSGL